MERRDYVIFLNEALDNQRLGLRLQSGLAFAVILLGALSILLTQLYPELFGIAGQEVLGALGGGTVSALSAFPIKQITERRARIAAMRFLRSGFQRAEQGGDGDSEALAQLEQRFWKLMDASLGR
jgi:hypothetical protein